MQKVLSSDLWKTVRAKSRKVECRKAAVAYVTKDLIAFRKGDTLIVNASRQAIASGETAANLLQSLHKKGVRIYDCPNLHAKVMLLDNVAIIGSGNLSNSSADGLVEAGLMTDHPSTVAGVASLIEQLCHQSNELTEKNIAALCKIEVVRRGGRGLAHKRRKRAKISQLGNQTWLVGITDMSEDMPPDEQRMIDRATKTLGAKKLIDPEDGLSWIRWAGKGRFRRECRPGDSVIRIWRSSKAKRPSAVLASVPVLLKQKTKKWTRFYLGEALGKYTEMPLGKFKKLLKMVGHTDRVGAGSQRLLEPVIAWEINKKWKSVAK